MDSLSHYLYNGPDFIMFGRIHILSISASILACIFLPIFISSFKRKTIDRVVFYLSLLVMFNIIVWMLLELMAGTFNVRSHLPLHLCRVANILLPVMVVSNNKTLYNILYYWSLSGIFQALITPDIAQTFPHYHFFRFFITHNVMIFVIILYSMHKHFRPTISGMWTSLIYMNIFLVFVFIVNMLLDSNYFWIMEKPPTSSLLDYLGPWPWYIFWAEFVALAHFAVAYLPIYIEKAFKKNKDRKKISSFTDFYPYYLSQHKVFLNRALHNTGLIFSIILFVFSIFKEMYLLLILCPLIGYSFAWYGHYYIEKNKPATFTFPLYSFIADWVMLWDTLRGEDFDKIIRKLDK